MAKYPLLSIKNSFFSLLLSQHICAWCVSTVTSSTMLLVGSETTLTAEKNAPWDLMSLNEHERVFVSHVVFVEENVWSYSWCNYPLHCFQHTWQSIDPQTIQSVTTLQFCLFVCFWKGWQIKENHNLTWNLNIYLTFFHCSWKWAVLFRCPLQKEDFNVYRRNHLTDKEKDNGVTCCRPLSRESEASCHSNRASVKL